MRPGTYLTAGFVCGAAIGGLFLVGPARLGNLYCRAAGCPITSDLDAICEIATKAESVPSTKRSTFLAKQFRAMWPTDNAVGLAEKIGTSAPGEKYDVILDRLKSDGEGPWSCPALTRMFLAPVGASLSYIVVDGVPIAELDRGSVRPDELDDGALVITPLYEALRRRGPAPELEIGLHPAVPFRTIAQILYTAGLAEYESVDLRLLDLNVPTARINLSPYGACNDCLAEFSELRTTEDRLAEPILAVVGRRAVDRARTDDMLAEDALRLTIALSNQSDMWIAGRGGVLPPRAGPDDFVTVSAGPSGPDFHEAALRLEQIRVSFPHDRGIVVTADLETRAAKFHRMLVMLEGTENQLYEHTMVAIPIRLLNNGAVLRDVFRRARSITLSTRAQLTKPERPKTNQVLASAPASLRTHRRRARRNAARRPVQSLADMFRPHLGSVQACYQRGLESNRSLTGKVVLRLDVTKDGSTANVSAEDESLGNTDVIACIEARAQQWHLPPPEKAPLSVAYPIVLRPSTM